MVELVLGLLLFLLGLITLIPGVVEKYDQKFQWRYWSALRAFRWPKVDWHEQWSRNVARVAIPVFLLVVGLALAIGGIKEIT